MKNKILVIACLVLVLCVSLVLPMATAFADYTEDVLNNPQAIVNFNQLITTQIDYSNSNTDNRDFFNFYLLFNNGLWKSEAISSTGYFDFILDVGTTTTGTLTIKHSGSTLDLNIYNQQFDAISGHYVYFRINVLGYNPSIVNGLQIKDFIAIDLTQMFGSNLPTLAQCHDLFVANYYAYSTGSAISLSGINAYQQGYDDAMSGFDVTYNGTLLQNNIFMVNGELWPISQSSDNLVSTSPDSNGINCFGFKIPFTTNNNDIITIKMDSLQIYRDYVDGVDNNFNPILYVGYFNNGAFVALATFDSNNSTIRGDGGIENGYWYEILDNGTISFNVPSLDAIYFRSTSNEYINFFGLNLTIQSTNVTALSQASFNQGYDKAKEYYLNLYSVGGSGYQAIYNKGYYDYPNDDHFTFKSLITSAVDVPVQAFTNLFDFDILGVNMKTFYLSVFTLCVIFVVLRLVL